MGAAVVSNARVWHAKLHKRSQEVLADKGLIFGFRKTPRSRSAAFILPRRFAGDGQARFSPWLRSENRDALARVSDSGFFAGFLRHRPMNRHHRAHGKVQKQTQRGQHCLQQSLRDKSSSKAAKNPTSTTTERSQPIGIKVALTIAIGQANDFADTPPRTR
jgi:hypothetical protein